MARGGAELADGARLAIFFAVVLTAFLAPCLAAFLATFLKLFFAALRAPFFAVFAFAPRVAIGKPLEKFRNHYFADHKRDAQIRATPFAGGSKLIAASAASRVRHELRPAIVDETPCVAEPTSATIHFQPGC